MKRALKTTAITVRLKPHVKAKLERLAMAEARSVAGYLEWLVLQEPEPGGVRPAAAPKVSAKPAQPVAGKAVSAPGKQPAAKPLPINPAWPKMDMDEEPERPPKVDKDKGR